MMRPFVGALTVALGALVIVACVPAPLGTAVPETLRPDPTPTLHDLAVTQHVRDTISFIDGERDDCRGSGAFSDIKSDAVVSVTDEAGTVLASAALGTGSGSNPDFDTPSHDSVLMTDCEFTTVIRNVPDRQRYLVVLGDRRAIEYTRAELENRDWAVQLIVER